MSANTRAKAQTFAEEVQQIIDATLPAYSHCDPDDRRVRCLAASRSGHFAIHPGAPTASEPTRGARLPLLKDGKRVASLRLNYLCTDDHRGEYLAVHRSSFELLGYGGGDNKAPIVRLDYLRDANKVPAVHWNVHGERGAVSHLLARCNPRHSGQLSKVHLPCGGPRWRPCLEDFLQVLFDEFCFDKMTGAMNAIHDGRERFRARQCATVVRDSPDVAAGALRELGYVVAEPSTKPSRNQVALRRF